MFLNHGITHAKNGVISKDESEFIDKYIFPGGELEPLSSVLTVMEDENYEVCDVECLREHYFKTLSIWVEKLQKNKDEAIAYTSEKTFRAWLLYMTGCALNFQAGYISIYQVLLSKTPKSGGFNIPLTREYMYE